MALYVFYTIQENDPIRASLENFDFPDDEMAVERAVQLLDRYPIEVWEHGDLVARLDPWPSEQPSNKNHAAVMAS